MIKYLILGISAFAILYFSTVVFFHGTDRGNIYRSSQIWIPFSANLLYKKDFRNGRIDYLFQVPHTADFLNSYNEDFKDFEDADPFSISHDFREAVLESSLAKPISFAIFEGSSYSEVAFSESANRILVRVFYPDFAD